MDSPRTDSTVAGAIGQKAKTADICGSAGFEMDLYLNFSASTEDREEGNNGVRGRSGLQLAFSLDCNFLDVLCSDALIACPLPLTALATMAAVETRCSSEKQSRFDCTSTSTLAVVGVRH